MLCVSHQRTNPVEELPSACSDSGTSSVNKRWPKCGFDKIVELRA